VNLGSASEIVTKEDIQDYLLEFSKIFNQQLESRFGLNSTTYSENLHYKAYVTVSNTLGTAIEFFPSNQSELFFRTTADTIENAVFPNLGINTTPPDLDAAIMIWTGEPNGTMFHVTGHDILFRNLIFVTNMGHFVTLGAEGELYLFAVTVDGRYYHGMILKGGNTKDYWTKDEAEKDAMEFFEHKSFYGFEQAETIRDIMAYPIFVELLSPVLWKQYNAEDIGYTLVQFEHDKNEISKIAVDMYHLKPGYVDGVYEWLEKITPRPIELPEPPWYATAPWDWILSWVTGSLMGVLATQVWFRTRKRKEMLAVAKERETTGGQKKEKNNENERDVL